MANTPTTVYGFNKPAQGDTPWTTSVNGDWDSLDTELSKPRIIFNSPTVGAGTTLDLSLGRVFVFTVSQATTISFTNVPTSAFAVRVRCLITNGSAFTLTWPAAVTWLAGTAPTLRASGVDEVELITKDGGVTWFGAPRSNLYQFIKADVGGFELQNTAGMSIFKALAGAGSRQVSARLGNSVSATQVGVPALVPITFTDTGTTSSGAGSPVNLKFYVIAADVLNVTNQGLRVRGIGTGANNANAKAVRVAVGATQIISQALQVSVADVWEIEVDIFRTGATTADCWAWALTNGTTAKVVTFTAVSGLSDWTTTGNTVQFSCTQVAAADVTQEGLLPTWLGT